MSEGCFEAFELWLGCAWLGVVFLSLNIVLRGAQLEHVFTDLGARVLIQQEQFAEQLGSVAGVLSELRWDFDELSEGESLLASSVRFGDVVTLLYTSGTTGLVKGVFCLQAQWYWWGCYMGDAFGVRPGNML